MFCHEFQYWRIYAFLCLFWEWSCAIFYTFCMSETNKCLYVCRPEIVKCLTNPCARSEAPGCSGGLQETGVDLCAPCGGGLGWVASLSGDPGQEAGKLSRPPLRSRRRRNNHFSLASIVNPSSKG